MPMAGEGTGSDQVIKLLGQFQFPQQRIKARIGAQIAEQGIELHRSERSSVLLIGTVEPRKRGVRFTAIGVSCSYLVRITVRKSALKCTDSRIGLGPLAHSPMHYGQDLKLARLIRFQLRGCQRGGCVPHQQQGHPLFRLRTGVGWIKGQQLARRSGRLIQ